MANKELKFGSNLVIVEYAKKDRLGNQIDTTYAKKSGDTFTGTLTVPSINISSDKYQLKLGTPAYPGTKPSSLIWNTDGISLSQGNAETSGLYLDGDKIVMWSPFDSPGFIMYDEDDGTIRFQVDGSGNIYENGTKLSSKYATTTYVDNAIGTALTTSV